MLMPRIELGDTIGVFLDDALSMQRVCRATYFHLDSICRNLLHWKTTETMGQRKWSAQRHYCPSSHQTPEIAKCYSASHNQNLETWSRQTCSDQPTLATLG